MYKYCYVKAGFVVLVVAFMVSCTRPRGTTVGLRTQIAGTTYWKDDELN